MESQLRDYQIDPEHLDAFLEAWTAGVLPLRRQFGFQVTAWVDREKARFVWVLRYIGDFEEADRRYYESKDRAGLDPDPAQWIVATQHSWVMPVE